MSIVVWVGQAFLGALGVTVACLVLAGALVFFRWLLTSAVGVQRLRFIGHLIETRGHFNRSDLTTKFGVSRPQASVDIRDFRKSNPGVVTYDSTTKRFESRALIASTIRGEGSET